MLRPREMYVRFSLNAIIGELNSGAQHGHCNGCGTVILVAGDSLRSYRASLKNVCVCMYIALLY